MKFGDKATFLVERVDKKGRGTGTIGSRHAVVPFAVPGEEVEARLVKRDGSELRMRLERVITPSPFRVQARCKYAGQCGGCAWQQFDYQLQLQMKRDLVNATLDKIHQRITEVVPALSLYEYRNRMDYCVGWKGEVGLKEPGRWNGYIDLEECHLLSPDAVEAMKRFRAWMKDNSIVPWDGKKNTGYARYLVIREGKRTGQRMITVVTADGELPARTKLIAALSPLCTTLYHGINPTITDLSNASILHLLHGVAELEEQIDGKTFRIPPNAFFQTNSEMAEMLVRTAREFLSAAKPKVLLDLYCGVGLFGICLAGDAERVVGVELEPTAIAVASGNAERNGIKNAHFVAAKAEELLQWQDEKPDTIIVDPPRSGLHPKVAETLLNLAVPRILYVSCNYESFVRDFAVLGRDYQIEKLAAIDLFPHSPHVETVALLGRNQNTRGMLTIPPVSTTLATRYVSS